jgi:hypothetical protein
MGGVEKWREAKNAANARIGKPRRKHLAFAITYLENESLSGVCDC